MPLTPSVTAPMFAGALAAAGIAGQGSPQLAAACAAALASYASSGLQVITADVGTAGAGSGVGAGVILTPAAASGALVASFAAAGLAGTHAAPTATALGLGFSQALAQAIVQSVHAGVGVGTGILQLIPNPGASVPIFVAAFAAAGLAGQSSAQMATATALGLDAALPSAKGVVVISGAGSMYPATSVGKGILL